jgi:hypothetical protein
MKTLITSLMLVFTICLANANCKNSNPISEARELLALQKKELQSAKWQLSSTRKSLSAAKSTVAFQKEEISKLQSQIDADNLYKQSLEQEILKVKEDNQKLAKKQLQTGRERDIFILAFTVLAVVSLFRLIKPLIEIIPYPYSWVAYIGLPIVGFVAVFYGIRLVVQLIVKLIF